MPEFGSLPRIIARGMQLYVEARVFPTQFALYIQDIEYVRSPGHMVIWGPCPKYRIWIEDDVG